MIPSFHPEEGQTPCHLPEKRIRFSKLRKDRGMRPFVENRFSF
jgi:hypothetical protein